MSLYKLLNLKASDDDDRSKYDDRAVIEQVRRYPNDAKRIYKFTAYYNLEYYPLYMAVMLGCSLEALEVLYEANPDAIQHKDSDGDTVLHDACEFKVSFEVATFLVEKYPAAVEMKGYSGKTPLHFACCWGAPLELVGMLLDKYPPALIIKDKWGNTPLMQAEKSDASPYVLELLREAEHRERSFFASRGSDLSKLLDLHPAKQRAEYDEEAVLTAVRRDPNVAKEKYLFAAFQYHFLYPLTMAVALGASLEVVKLIYDAHHEAIHGANVRRQTTLHYGCRYKASADVIKFLLDKHRSAVDAEDKQGNTPSMLAKENNASPEVTQLLLDAHSLFAVLNLHPINDRTSYDDEAVFKAIQQDPKASKQQHTFPAYDKSLKCYPLTMAVALGASLEVVKLIYGAHREAIHSLDEKGQTPLHYGCQYNTSVDVIKFLLKKHISAIDAKDDNGFTPLMLASSYSSPEVMKLLQKTNASWTVAAGRWIKKKTKKETQSPASLKKAENTSKATKKETKSPALLKKAKDTSKVVATSTSSSSVRPPPVSIPVVSSPTAPSGDHKKNVGGPKELFPSEMLAPTKPIDREDEFETPTKPSKTTHDKTEANVETGTAKQSSQQANTSTSDFSPEVVPEKSSKPVEQEGQLSPAPNQVDVMSLTPSELAAVKAITSNMRDFDKYFASTGVTLTPQDQEAIRILTVNLEDFNRSLESVRGLPATLLAKPDHVKDYFRIFTSGFERTYVAALTLSSGAVKGQLTKRNRQMLASVLEVWGSFSIASNIPLLGFVAIFTSSVNHMLLQQESNMLCVFQDFFCGQSRDEYLLTYRTAAEHICLQPDYLSSYGDANCDVGPLHTKVKKAIERVQKRLQRSHLQAISSLKPIELKAMDDLSTVTDCVLKLWLDKRDEYNVLKEGSHNTKADYVLKALSIDSFIAEADFVPKGRSIDCAITPSSPGEQTSESGLKNRSAYSPHNTSNESPYQGSGIRRDDSDVETFRQLQEKLRHLEQQARQNQELHEKMQLLEEENRVNRENQLRQNKKLQWLEKQNKELEEQVALHLGDESLDVDVGGYGARQMRLRSKQSKEKARAAASKRGETTGRYDASELIEEFHDLRHKLGKVTDSTKKNRLDIFVANRVMTVLEAKLLVHNILLRSSDDLRGKGQIKHHSSIAADSKGCFTVNERKYRIGKFRGNSSSWKRDMQVKIDQDHNGAKSVMSWFEENGLGYRYELHNRVVIQEMFADELEL